MGGGGGGNGRVEGIYDIHTYFSVSEIATSQYLVTMATQLKVSVANGFALMCSLSQARKCLAQMTTPREVARGHVPKMHFF